MYHPYIEEPLVGRNVFREMVYDPAPLIEYDAAAPLLPAPFWEGHDAVVACHDKAWRLAFQNLRQPAAGSGFIANFIDTAFNGNLFMWDSVFILMFARYGHNAFAFQRTLDNFYTKQHPDGFICREIQETDGEDCFHRFDPASTGPNILAWSEWEYYCTFADRPRLARVFPVLLAYHRWLRRYRTWPDGTYWSSGWGSGMDNQPRQPGEEFPEWYHGHISWIDVCLQQVLSARLLLRMAGVLGEEETTDLSQESQALTVFINNRMWDERTAFYYDLLPDGSFSMVKTIGAYWALLAEAVPRERRRSFLAHLQDPREFMRSHRVPSLAADHPAYRKDGGYWLGGVWAPTNYMILRGLSHIGADALAHEIALNHLANVVRVFETTGTLWENYAPESSAPGNPAKPDFVGWTGLPPVAMLYEYAFGLRSDVAKARLIWDVRLLEEHAVQRYPFGRGGLLDLACARRASAGEKPVIEAKANMPLVLEIRWAGGRELRQLSAEA